MDNIETALDMLEKCYFEVEKDRLALKEENSRLKKHIDELETRLLDVYCQPEQVNDNG